MPRKYLLIAALAASITAHAGMLPVPLQEAPEVLVPGGATMADVEKAIVTGGALLDWNVTDRKPGVMVLDYAPRDVKVEVTVTYDVQHVTIAYKSSNSAMKYGMENGQVVIHPNYNRWVRNLAHDIEAELKAVSLK